MAFIEMKDVTLQFGGLKACSNVSLELGPGILYGLIGPNGAGKSTLFNMLTGIYAPTKGDILMNGESIVGKKSFEIAQMGVGRTFQNIRLFKDLTVEQNVMTAFFSQSKSTLATCFWGTQSYQDEEQEVREKSKKLLDRMGLLDHAQDLAGSLPYGKQRKLEIARALGLEPKLLLLDEPAAGLNPSETRELTGLIRAIQKERGITVLLIEHDMRLVMDICEKIFVLVQGELTCEGVPDVVQNDPKVIQAYLGVDE